jgi:hypothetical protein
MRIPLQIEASITPVAGATEDSVPTHLPRLLVSAPPFLFPSFQRMLATILEKMDEGAMKTSPITVFAFLFCQPSNRGKFSPHYSSFFMSFLNLIVAQQPSCRDPVQSIVAEFLDGTQDHWRHVFYKVLRDLLESVEVYKYDPFDLIDVDDPRGEPGFYYEEDFGPWHDYMFSECKKWKSWWSRFDAVVEELTLTSIGDDSSDAKRLRGCTVLQLHGKP